MKTPEVEFNQLSSGLVEILERFNIKEADLFRHATDLYIGIKRSRATEARKILVCLRDYSKAAEVFQPQRGSSMENYCTGIEIPLALIDDDIKKKRERLQK